MNDGFNTHDMLSVVYFTRLLHQPSEIRNSNPDLNHLIIKKTLVSFFAISSMKMLLLLR